MAGTAALIIKVMPDSPEADLEAIKSKAQSALESHGAQQISFEENPVAFGLKALMIKMAWDEEVDTDKATQALEEIEHVSSTSIEDYRRAFG